MCLEATYARRRGDNLPTVTLRGRRLLWLLIGAGLTGRVALAFATYGQDFDIGSLHIVAAQLGDDPLDLYSTVNGEFELGGFAAGRWPYPSGIFPWLAATVGIEKATGLPFHGIVQLAPIAADALIAWLVQSFLGRRGASERIRLAAVAAVMAGPSFWAISGYHGQIDSVAILPAVAALVVWEDGPAGRRALLAGLLIGLGGSVKLVPLFMLVALLGSARSVREAVTLVGAAAGVMVAAMAPFVLADADGVRTALSYSGAPGLGGISLLVQPELSTAVLTRRFDGVQAGTAAQTLYDHGKVLVVLALAAVAAFSFRYRPSAVQAAVLLWLAFYAITPAFFFQYAVWGLPFFLMAGHVAQVFALQALLAPAMAAFYLLPWESDRVALVYVPVMALVWLAWVVALALQARSIVRRGRPDVGLAST